MEPQADTTEATEHTHTTANIYTNSRYAFGVAHDFGMLWEQCGFLTSSGNKIVNVLHIQELLSAIFLSAVQLLLRFQGIRNLTLEAKGKHLADMSARNAALKGINGASLVAQW